MCFANKKKNKKKGKERKHKVITYVNVKFLLNEVLGDIFTKYLEQNSNILFQYVNF